MHTFDIISIFVTMPHLLKCWFILLSSVIPDNTAVDPVIEEHFRRSLGKNYKEPEPISNSVSITGSVDDHFAKALGKTWLQIKAKGPGGGPQRPTPERWAEPPSLLSGETQSLLFSIPFIFHIHSMDSISMVRRTLLLSVWLPGAELPSFSLAACHCDRVIYFI